MAKTKKKATPADRARARRDPAIFRAPKRIRGRKDTVASLRMNVGGRVFPIGADVEGDTPWSMGMEEAGTVTLPVRDPNGKLLKILSDENLLQRDGVRVTVDGVVYVVASVEHDGGGLYTLALEDEVAWILRGFDSYRVASRASTTRFGFIYGFVREASARPLKKMEAYIPEVDDKRPIRRAPRKRR